VVKVRLQTQRDGDVYSEDSTVATLTIDTEGPTVPLAAYTWPGTLPEKS